MTVLLGDDIKDRLDGLAEATQRSKSWWAAEAIREHVELNEWHASETRAALAEADASDFASDEDGEALRRKWEANAAWVVGHGVAQPRRSGDLHGRRRAQGGTTRGGPNP